MRFRSYFCFLTVLVLIGSCAETDLDPKQRWGGGLKGVMATVRLASESTAKGPLDKICGTSPDIPTNCVAECAAVDPGTGWFLTGTLTCNNQPPNLPGNGLWESVCGDFKEGLQAGQDEGGPHNLTFTVTKPTGRAAGSITLKLEMKGDIFLLPYAIDKIWVSGIYYFSKTLTAGGAAAFTVADMPLECRSDSKIAVDMLNVECQLFKESIYDQVSCS